MPAVKTKRRTYKFDQLGQEARERAIEDWRKLCNEWGDDGLLKETLNEDLSELYGLTNCDVSYSLHYCQGDGVAFTGHPDIDTWAEHDEALTEKLTQLRAWTALAGEEEPQIRLKIENHDRYTHWNSMTLYLENEADWNVYSGNDEVIAGLNKMVSDIEKYLIEAIQGISRKLEKSGYEEIQYQDSDECISETLSDSQHRFTRSGERL